MKKSKHSAKPGEGKVNIDQHSSLRKLARALRRGVVPDDRMFLIVEAQSSANERLLGEIQKINMNVKEAA